MADDTKLPLTSGYPTEAMLARLREEAPHVFSEGKVDWDKLRATLGESIETRSERYGLTWAGKAEAFRAVQAASVGTIAYITRERVRRVIAKLNEADAGKLDLDGQSKQDRGFRAFKLSSSNFKIWDTNQAATDPEQLAEQLHLYTDNLAESRTRQDILYELILKSGLPLTAKVEAQTVAGKTVHSIAEGNLLICLENPVTQELLRGMMALEPLQILCLDTAFHGNDPLKTNAVLEAKSHGITFRTV